MCPRAAPRPVQVDLRNRAMANWAVWEAFYSIKLSQKRHHKRSLVMTVVRADDLHTLRSQGYMEKPIRLQHTGWGDTWPFDLSSRHCVFISKGRDNLGLVWGE